ncbi:MAG: hypothetical protein K2X66_05760, partial [Cyanobacteria bacterium]|nr:hypothetical protein [Cyanobacteriota bacterium]
SSPPSANGQSSTLASLPSASNNSAAAQVIQSGFDATPNSNTLSFDISENGKTVHVSIPNYPDSLKTGVETVGTDGTTQNYAATLKTLADTLEEEGVLTPEKAQLIRDIANTGFYLSARQAELQKGLADAPQNGGKLMVIDMSQPQPVLTPINPTQVLRFASPAGTIQKSFEKAKAAGALNNPILQRVVLDSVNNLKKSGSISADYLVNIIERRSSGGSGNTNPQYTASDLNNFVMTQSQLQEMDLMRQAQGSVEDSTKICDASGKSKVEGLNCKPAQPKETAPPQKALPSPTTAKPTPSQMGNLASDFNLNKP